MSRRTRTSRGRPEAMLWPEADAGSNSNRKLVLAALEAFSERGYHGTTTRDIARLADMSAAAIYMHYASKADLLFALVKRMHEEALAQMRCAAEVPAPPLERIRNIVRTHVAYHAAMHVGARVANYELHVLPREHRAEVLALRDEMDSVMRDALRAGIQAGDVRVNDLDITTYMILSLAIDISRWFSDKGRLSPDEIAALYADNVVRMVSAHAPGAVDARVTPNGGGRRRAAPRGTGGGGTVAARRSARTPA